MSTREAPENRAHDPNRRVDIDSIRERLARKQTLTLEEYRAGNPDNAPLTEDITTVKSHFKDNHAVTGNEKVDRANNTLQPGRTGQAGRVRFPGPST